MLIATMDIGALAGVRLTVSPALEAMLWLRIAASGARHPVFGDPGPAARDALRDPDVAIVARCLPKVGRPGYAPDLLTPLPPPARADRLLAAQLDIVAATSAEAAAAEIVRTPGAAHRDVRAAVDDGTYARRAARGLHRFWRLAIADQWRALRAGLDADIAGKSRTLAGAGLGALFASVHPDVTWTGGGLLLHRPGRGSAHCTGDFVVVPTALGVSDCLQAHLGAGSMLGYPTPVTPRQAATARLVGSTRAAVLADLDRPRTTTEVAARLGIAPATASHHLRVLLDAGLVGRARDGKAVRYRRTATGDLLG